MQSDDISTKQAFKKFEKLSVGSSSSNSLAQTAVKIRDAVHYIENIKERFLEDESEVYDEFLLLMDEFKNHSSVMRRSTTDPSTHEMIAMQYQYDGRDQEDQNAFL